VASEPPLATTLGVKVLEMGGNVLMHQLRHPSHYLLLIPISADLRLFRPHNEH